LKLADQLDLGRGWEQGRRGRKSDWERKRVGEGKGRER